MLIADGIYNSAEDLYCSPVVVFKPGAEILHPRNFVVVVAEIHIVQVIITNEPVQLVIGNPFTTIFYFVYELLLSHACQ